MKKNLPKHLVFYDGVCGFCDRSVQLLLKLDKKQLFCFAPLQGETAKILLQALTPEQMNEDSLVLIENFRSEDKRIYLLGKAIFRICWLLGGVWLLLGWIRFLPAVFYDWGYRLFAKNRHRFFEQGSCVVPDPASRDCYLP
jgi:predicted DCC family thiol-disulfide oxidoreductase YuxK